MQKRGKNMGLNMIVVQYSVIHIHEFFNRDYVSRYKILRFHPNPQKLVATKNRHLPTLE